MLRSTSFHPPAHDGWPILTMLHSTSGNVSSSTSDNTTTSESKSVFSKLLYLTRFESLEESDCPSASLFLFWRALAAAIEAFFADLLDFDRRGIGNEIPI